MPRKPRTSTGPFPQLLLDTHDELIVDLFAGGGGASLGIEMATGRQVDVAINHDSAAVALHKANHPQTTHHTCDVFEADPRVVTSGRPVGLLWASPDCTDHSKAKGGKPFRESARKRRALAWVVTRWAGQVRPRVICLENVEEFADWSPLIGPRDALRRDPRRKGRTFRRWRRSLERLGYVVEHREIRASDLGAPTIRKRLYVIARCDGRPIVWPAATHGPKTRHPYLTAASCIDWSVPMLSIFADREEARAWGKAHGQASPIRPLAEATMRRIARGVKRFVLDAAKPFIVPNNTNNAPHSIDDPLPTVTGGGRHILAAPLITKFRGGAVGNAIDEPLRTITANSATGRPGGCTPLGVVAPILTHLTHHGDERSHAADAPAPTITGAQRGELGLVAPSLIHIGNGEREGQAPRALDIEAPLNTIVGSPKHGLVAAFLAQHNTDMVGHDVRKPVSTIVQKGSTQGLVAASLTKLRGTSSAADVAGPLHTTSAGGTHHGLVAANLFANYSETSLGGRASSPEEPVRTVTGTQRHGLVASFLQRYNAQGIGSPVDEPAQTISTKDRFGVVTVTIEGQPYVIVDIAMRMLQPRELFRAQGFPDSYVIDRGADGRALTKTVQVRLVGNSVCPPVAAAIVRANCPELRARDEVAA